METMAKSRGGEDVRWYVIHTHPKQEDRVSSNLQVLGVSIVNPKIRDRRYSEYLIAPTYVVKPLFPRYIFAQFCLKDLFHKVRYTRGVYRLVSFGDTPTTVEDEVIALIQSNLKSDGYAKIEEALCPGDRVIVKDGPLRNFAGIFERSMKDTDRIRILLETVSYQASIEIERDLVRKSC
jgi:transcriptional antiterminator RfaH